MGRSVGPRSFRLAFFKKGLLCFTQAALAQLVEGLSVGSGDTVSFLGGAILYTLKKEVVTSSLKGGNATSC